jgi:hypothetical protein
MKTKDFSLLNVTGLAAQFLEIRIDYNGGSNPVYVGYSLVPQADDNAPVWYIVMLDYTAGNLTAQHLGTLGNQWTYIWANRASYF